MNYPCKISRSIMVMVLLLLFNGCSTIKKYFPDKEKEYVNSVEIPALVIPPDLSNKSVEEHTIAATAEMAPASSTEEVAPIPPKIQPEKVRLVNYAGGATRLQIDEPYVRAWRIVGKALTRKSLEIIERNINEGLYLIQYDPNEKDIEDGSLWDEFIFLFGEDQSNEQEYQIRLIENEDKIHTEVMVLDQQGVALSQGVGLTLLNLMHETIKADLAEQK